MYNHTDFNKIKMDIQKLTDSWINGAEKDWLACEHLYAHKDYPQCLFWGHLVLEKILKAIIIHGTNTQAPYTHDLVLLARKAKLKLTQEQRDYLNEINTFNQFGRYDNEIITFIEKCTTEYANKYFNIIKQLYTWLSDFFHKQRSMK